MRLRLCRVLLAPALLGSLLLASPAALAQARATGPAHAGRQAASPLTLLATSAPSARVRDYTFATAALAAPTSVRVLLPDGYDPSGRTRYPVLYLLHGGAGHYADWTTSGAAAALTAGLPLIVVMPDAGRSAWYTDWFHPGTSGQPKWETYHVDQFVPWVDAHLPTEGRRSGRAIIGLSSGGFGAMSYAARHQDLFVAAAAFSGALDTNTPSVASGVVIGGLAAQDGGTPDSFWGLRATDEVRWRGHNPWDLAENLRHTALTVRMGNGMAGGDFGGGGPTDPGGTALEVATHAESVSFHDRLVALGLPHVYEDYGPGTHSWPYWQRDLRKTLPWLMAVLSQHRPDPTSFSTTAIEPSFGAYGWTVNVTRPALEFSSLTVDGPGRFTVAGSGTADVTTAAVYPRSRTVKVTVLDATGTHRSRARTDSSGRLHVSVDLGAGNLVQQEYAETGTSPATVVRNATVTVRPAR